LAAAGRADEGDALATLDLESDPLEGLRQDLAATAERLVDGGDPDDGAGGDGLGGGHRFVAPVEVESAIGGSRTAAEDDHLDDPDDEIERDSEQAAGDDRRPELLGP